MARQLSWLQVAQVARAAGWPADEAITAVAITMPESSRIPAAVQQGQPYATTGWGLWQITPGNSVPQFGVDQQMLDPLNNAKAARWKHDNAGGFGPWTTYTSGAYAQYLAPATTAVAQAYKLSPAALAAAVKKARSADAGTMISAPQAQDWSYLVSAASHDARQKMRRTAAVTKVLHEVRPHLAAPHLVFPPPEEILIKPERIRHER